MPFDDVRLDVAYPLPSHMTTFARLGPRASCG